MMTNLIRAATDKVADFTIGTAIVMVHLVMADRQRRKAALRPTPSLLTASRVHN